MTTDPILSSGTAIATSPEDDMTLPSLESVFKAVRRVRAAEEKLIQERNLRDDEMLRAVEGGWKPAHISQRLIAKFGRFPGIAPMTVVQGINAARARRKQDD
jgi:hypothetical protein